VRPALASAPWRPIPAGPMARIRCVRPILPDSSTGASSKRSRPCWRGPGNGVRSVAERPERSRELRIAPTCGPVDQGRPADGDGTGSGPYCPCLSVPSGRGDRPQFNDAAPTPGPVSVQPSSRAQETLLAGTSSGGRLGFNDAWSMQLGVPRLPFGGRGRPAHGQLHGKAGLSNLLAPIAACFDAPSVRSAVRYPPLRRTPRSLIKRLLGWNPLPEGWAMVRLLMVRHLLS